jgi:raffinose/stachyose/melibiose transport system substrate-binding protein
MFRKMGHLLPLTLVSAALVAPFQASAQENRIFNIWYFQQDDAMDKSWEYAMEQFQLMHPDVTIEFEQKSFEQTVETARMVLNSNNVPDVMQINKGNATAGLYAKEGLLTDLTSVAEERGWTDILQPSIQTTMRYDENGIMGNGPIYGVTTYGEFILVYYNKDMFEAHNIEVPTTLEELEATSDTFVAAGITPFTLGALEKWPPTHIWNELILYEADREFINAFQFFQGDLDFHGTTMQKGTDHFIDWVKKGYLNPNANGATYEDSSAAFVQGEYPMNLTGSWQFGLYMDQITDFEWGIFLMPGKKLVTGSGGNMWVVPANAVNKDLAYDFINLTLQPDAQNVMANSGGIPVNADLDAIDNEQIRTLNAAFATIIENDGLAFYPDWPVPGYMDVLGSGLQELLNGSTDSSAFLDTLAMPFMDYKASLR